MSEFVFSNRFDTANYYGGLIEGETALDLKLLGNVAFVTKEQSEKSEFTLDEAWTSRNGAILVMGRQPMDPVAIAKMVVAKILKPRVGLIWVEDPNVRFEDWNSAVFPFSNVDGSHVLTNRVELALTGEETGYGLHFAEGLAVTPDAETNSLLFAGGEISFGRDETWFPAISNQLAIDLGAPPGPKLEIDFTIPGGDELVTSLDAMGLGFWFSKTPDGGERVAYRYPLFESHKSHDGLSCKAELTLNALLDSSLTKISAAPSGTPTANFVTWFRSILGRSLTATLRGSFGMAFNPAGAGAFGLSPTGQMELRFSDQTRREAAPEISKRDRGFACGTTGTECIVMPEGQDENITVHLVPGQPSCVRMAGDDVSMADDTTTSWLKFTLPQPVPPAADELLMLYEAQPPGQGTLFDATQASVPPVSILPYFRPVPVALPNDASAPVMPMVPLAGIKKGSEKGPIDLAVTAIGPVRKAQIVQTEAVRISCGGVERKFPANITVDEGETHTAITPRGLEATFDDSGWVSVQIARLLGILPGNAGQLRFAGENGIIDPLKAALMTSEQFLVVSDPESIKQFFADPPPPPPPPLSSAGDASQLDDAETNTKVTLRDWEFLLGPEFWKAHGTILILKNTPVAMQDLIGDLSSWTSADQFNKDPAATSRRLQEIADKARHSMQAGRDRMAQMIGVDPGDATHDFDFFVQSVLDSPNWNGFLLLNAQLGAFPNDLAGIRAGIKPDCLYAHHVGVTQTPFTSLADLQNRSSSMFGLIRYEDESKLSGNGLSYTFRVRELGVRFAESDVCDFRSTIDLALGEMFGQRSRLADGTFPVSEMIGTRQVRTGGDGYSFNATKPITVKPGAGPLQTIQLLQGEFVTKSIDEVAGEVHSDFNFAGWLELSSPAPGLGEYDVLSFDELAFSNLTIAMTTLDGPPAKTSYAFNTDQFELDEGLSVARPGSLFEGFPIKLDKLVHGKGKPDAQGNMTVQMPYKPKSLPANWYGFTQIIDMGALSEVAGAAGLEARLLTAWGKEPGQHYVGLKFSGPNLSGIGVDMDLLSVLKLRAYALDLRNEGDQWTLMMHGVNLSIFSKTLPPGGAFEFYIFGVPDPSGSANSLGWYAAWIAEKEKEAKSNEMINQIVTGDLIEAAPILTHSPRLRFRDAAKTKGD